MRIAPASLVMLGALALAACSEEPPAPKPEETEVPKALQGGAITPNSDISAAAEIGTPMEDRVATLGLLNKRNNLTQDLQMKPGESRRIGNVIVRLQACERTPPWEMPQETGAFVQVLVQDRDDPEFRQIFSGWLFRNSPSLNVVEHPIYDVWVKDCAMSFPGDEAPVRSAPSPSATPSAAPAPAPAPAPSAAPSSEE